MSNKINMKTVDGLEEGLANKADIALTNSPYTTNRILEIPQNIKLEFNSGTVTLKAGSKLYDGLGGEHIVPSDMSFSTASGGATEQIMLIKTDFSTAIFSAPFDTNLSYNSTTGLVEYTGLGSYYLPAGVTTHSSSTYTGIESIFNGFGYVASTVFILPGIRVQIPNGKNEDGTFKSILFTKTNIEVQTLPSSSASDWLDVFIAPSQSYCLRNLGLLVYDSDANLNVDSAGDYRFIIGQVFLKEGKFSKSIHGTVDATANSNASNFSQAGRNTLIGWSIPLYSAGITLSNSTTNTITTKGWVQYTAIRTNAIGSVTVSGLIFQSGSSATNDRGSILIPVDIGDTVTVGAGGSSDTLYFFPCKGV